MLVYATVDDLEAWLMDDVPDNAAQLIRSASSLVRTATRCDYYNVDVAGKPSDVDVLQAFNDATCAQAAMWITAGINPQGSIAAVVGTGPVSSSAVLTGHVTYATAGATGTQNVTALQDAAVSLCNESQEILTHAGLCQNGPWIVG